MHQSAGGDAAPSPGENLEEVAAERRRLLAIGYRMLGTLAEAEDAVQETYLRWYRLEDAEREAIANPQGWLTRVMSRVCLDVLGSARSRRESYVGEWLPEPVPEDLFAGSAHLAGGSPADPAEKATLDDQVSMALLVVMGGMTPAERVAFVLHDVFSLPFAEIAEIVGRSPGAVRQLASSARARVREQDALPGSTREHDRVMEAFTAACAEGDLAGLMGMLDPSVTLLADGGGVVTAARRPVLGADHVARFLVGVHRKHPEAELRRHRTGDGLAVSLWDGGHLHALTTIRVRDGIVTDVWMQVNPGKLTTWIAQG
ncbi:RNA polymerase sigma factor SigJ [Brachybacterium sp. NBEC-018]|uniref:RNA polymerase sigma factor SigJ n=1 Tax=Brachybacterium sp. NBEC-018 TaxID=2996004 RepID=UPI0021755A68|nr:RNA polymerase sigma factor SigJ [Brachybacterium sp. NBEC-018]UVY84050.1 RNA polymerase sigma factor SigJ [Brachybacterium sp. NBEC-018]